MNQISTICLPSIHISKLCATTINHPLASISQLSSISQSLTVSSPSIPVYNSQSTTGKHLSSRGQIPKQPKTGLLQFMCWCDSLQDESFPEKNDGFNGQQSMASIKSMVLIWMFYHGCFTMSAYVSNQYGYMAKQSMAVCECTTCVHWHLHLKVLTSASCGNLELAGGRRWVEWEFQYGSGFVQGRMIVQSHASKSCLILGMCQMDSNGINCCSAMPVLVCNSKFPRCCPIRAQVTSGLPCFQRCQDEQVNPMSKNW